MTKGKLEIYQADDDQWYWHLMLNGRIVADSGEGYTRRKPCREMAYRLFGVDGTLRPDVIDVSVR